MSLFIFTAIGALMTINGKTNEGINPQCVFRDMFDIAK